MTLTKVASRAAAAVVAAVAGIVSYGHIRAVALAVGESELAAILLPIGIDGLIIVATLAMLEDSRSGRVPRMSARLALAFGIAATVAFNVASAEPSWTARVVAAVPAVSFLLAIEVLVRSGQPKPASDKPVTSENATESTESQDQGSGGHRTTSKRRRKSTAERVAAAVARTPDATAAELAARLKVSPRTVQRYRPAATAVLNGHAAEGSDQ